MPKAWLFTPVEKPPHKESRGLGKLTKAQGTQFLSLLVLMVRKRLKKDQSPLLLFQEEIHSPLLLAFPPK